jgi:NAD(P)H-flavin reductase
MLHAPEAVTGMPGAMTPSAFRVATRERETADTWTLALERVGGARPEIGPGQFMMVYAFGVGEVPISVSGASGRAGPVVLTVRDVGAVTHAICTAGVGDVLGVRGPFGTAWPVESAAGGDVVVVAGGIGLAPLRPVVLSVLARRSSYAGAALLYGARTPHDLLFTAELADWRADIDVDVTVDAADSGWHGKVGVVPDLVSAAGFRPAETTAFVCGPDVMMRFTVDALLGRGVAAERIMLSLERNMRCGIGLCGHCQLGPTLVCRDGAVYAYADVAPWLGVREL